MSQAGAGDPVAVDQQAFVLVTQPRRALFGGAELSDHPSRCARELGNRFGDSAYAAEELIAEMGSAFLCADLGITPEVRADHAQYLRQWLGILQDDKRAIFTAAAQAQRAADYLHSLQPKPQPSPPDPARRSTTLPVPDFALT